MCWLFHDTAQLKRHFRDDGNALCLHGAVWSLVTCGVDTSTMADVTEDLSF